MLMQLKKFPLLVLSLMLFAYTFAIQAQTEVMVRAYRTVNVRSGPSTAYPVIGQLTINTVAQVTGRSDAENNWLRIDFDGQPGWVAYFTVSVEGNADSLPIVDAAPATASITIINTPTLNLLAPEEERTHVTSFRRVNVRSGPSTEYERISTLRAGETAVVVGRTEDNQWLQVNAGEFTGWVAYFVVSVTGELEEIPVVTAPTMTPTSTPTVTPTPILPTETPLVVLLTTRFNTNLRAQPSFTSEIVTVVPYSTTLEVEARTEDADWLRVTYEGETGWLLASLVEMPTRRIIDRLPVDAAVDAGGEG